MESVQQGAYSLSFNTFTDLLVKFFCLNKIHIFRFVDILPPRLNEKCIMLLILTHLVMAGIYARMNINIKLILSN